MTNLTFSTFVGSIKQGRIPKQSKVLNARLKEIRENIIETATEEAEKSIRESVIGTEFKSTTSELDAKKCWKTKNFLMRLLLIPSQVFFK